MDWLHTASGFLVGFVVGITGVGGGSLMTPLLVLAFGVAPVTAVGTDLLFASVTKAFGGWVRHRRGAVDWKGVKLLALGSVPASILSLWLLHVLSVDEGRLNVLIAGVLSIALVSTAAALLLGPHLQRLAKRPDGAPYEVHARNLPGATVITGAVLGVLVTLSSVGAGALGVVVLLLLYPRASLAVTVGTDIAHAAALTLVAGLGHAVLGTVDYGLLGSLLLGSLPGIYLGSQIGLRIPDRVLRPLLAGMLLLIGGRLVLA